MDERRTERAIETPTETIPETIDRIGDDTVELLQEVRESLRDSLEQVEWRWHHIENRLAQLKEQLRQPKDDAAEAVTRFRAEMKQSSAAVLGALRDLARS